VIFHDQNDIAWGQSWPQRIDEALDAVTLLLLIIAEPVPQPAVPGGVRQVPGPGRDRITIVGLD
jgi:hypothetical protein